MKLFKSLLLSVLFIAAISFTGCNEEPITSVTPDNTTSLSKLTLPAGAVITNATFNIYVEDPYDHDITTHQVNVPWNEATETWNIFIGKTAPQFEAASLGGFNAGTSGWKTVDILALVQAWVDGTTDNNGVLLNQPIVGGWLNNYRSKEYGDGSSAPYLEVTYTVGGGAPVTVQEPAFGDTYISTVTPDTPYGDAIALLNGRPLVDYIKYVLVQFDIEGTPVEECYQEETAWAANGSVPGSIRYVTRGNWATYLTYGGVAKTVNIYAGQTNLAGTAQLSAVSGGMVTITITLSGGWELNPMEGETVKIQGYTNTPPASNPAPGQFTTYKGTNLTVTVPAFNFYGIHLDVRKAIACP